METGTIFSGENLVVYIKILNTDLMVFLLEMPYTNKHKNLCTIYIL